MIDTESIVRRLHDERALTCDWRYSNPCEYRCQASDDIRAAVNATLAALPSEGEVERLRAEVERLDAALEESQGDLDQLESDVGEYLPAYLLDEDDVANYRERVEYAGRDLKMLEVEVSQLRSRVAELEKDRREQRELKKP